MKTPIEKGYSIPVKKQIEKGKYRIAYAKSLTPIKGKIKICYDSGKTSEWDADKTIHEPLGFKKRKNYLEL